MAPGAIAARRRKIVAQGVDSLLALAYIYVIASAQGRSANGRKATTMSTISRKHALKLIRAGRAAVDGAVYEPDYRTGERDRVIVIRYDLQRIDHYDYTPADCAAVDAAERRYEADA